MNVNPMKTTGIFTLLLALGLSLQGQGVYRLSAVTTNDLGNPLSYLSVLFDSSQATMDLSNQYTAIYDGPADGFLTNQQVSLLFTGMRMRVGGPGFGIFFLFTNALSSDQVNVNFRWSSYPFTDVSIDGAMATLENGALPPIFQGVLINGGTLENISSFSVSGVPEPPKIFLAGTGIASAIWGRRLFSRHGLRRRGCCNRHAAVRTNSTAPN